MRCLCSALLPTTLQLTSLASLSARSSYETALEAAITAFKSHLSTSQWQAIPPNAPREPISDEIVNGVQLPARVSVYRKPTKAGDVVRAQADVLVEEPVNLSAFAALLQSPEARSHCAQLVQLSARDCQLSKGLQGILWWRGLRR